MRKAGEGVKKLAVMLSEASAFISLRTDRCRFLAALGMTGLVDFFTTSEAFLEARQRSRSKDWG